MDTLTILGQTIALAPQLQSSQAPAHNTTAVPHHCIGESPSLFYDNTPEHKRRHIPELEALQARIHYVASAMALGLSRGQTWLG